MNSSDIRISQEDEERIQAAAEEIIGSGVLGSVKRALDRVSSEVTDSITSWIEEEGAYLTIVDAIQRYASEVVEAIIEGNQDKMLSALQARHYSGRYQEVEGGKPWAQVIHGSVFETEAIQLRKKIVEAHADLIRDERIKDLESIVEGLLEQIARAQERGQWV